MTNVWLATETNELPDAPSMPPVDCLPMWLEEWFLACIDDTTIGEGK